MIACWCTSLPDTPLPLKSKVFILQHPLEEKRNLRTATILEIACGDHCQVIRGRKFSSGRNSGLKNVLTEEKDKTIVLFPGDDAVKLADLPVIPGG